MQYISWPQSLRTSAQTGTHSQRARLSDSAADRASTKCCHIPGMISARGVKVRKNSMEVRKRVTQSFPHYQQNSFCYRYNEKMGKVKSSPLVYPRDRRSRSIRWLIGFLCTFDGNKKLTRLSVHDFKGRGLSRRERKQSTPRRKASWAEVEVWNMCVGRLE